MSDLGLESKRVRLVPYSARWKALYESDARRIQTELAARGLDVRLEHTGSTAVPGLSAKPIIDILAGLHRESDRAGAIEAIVAAGYQHRGESGIPGRDFFRRGDPRSYHVHLTTTDSQFFSDHLTFRDWLRQHASVRDAYAQVKAHLAARFPNDREAYILGKTDFVEATLRAARATRAGATGST